MYIALTLLFILSIFWRKLNNVDIIFSVPILITVIVGHLGFITFSFAYNLPFQLGDNLSFESYKMAEYLFITSVLSFVFGGRFFSSSNISIKSSEISFDEFKINSKLVFFISFVPAIMLFQAYGWGGVLYRAEYIPENIAYLKSAGRIFAIVVLFILPNTKLSKINVFLLYFLYFFLFFSYGSRMMAVIPVVYILSNVIFKSDKIISVKMFLSALLCFLSIILAIQLRRADDHGFIPYFLNLLNSGIDMELMRVSLNYFTSYSYSLTAYLVERGFTSEQLFWNSVTPLPGSMIGWSEVSYQLRVNTFVPFNAFFELHNKGEYYLITYFFLSGLVFSKIEKTIKGQSLIFYALFLMLVMLFVFTCLQYNLRNSTRLVYYSLMVLFAFYLYKGFKGMAIKIKR